ncbi:hypothetical protein MASR1M32_31180 [Rhodobacter sp.]
MTAQSRKARIGVVGVGWWSCVNHIPALQASDIADCVAICDLDTDRLAQVAAHFGIPAQYTDVTEMVRAEKLDGVIVATPMSPIAAPPWRRLRPAPM